MRKIKQLLGLFVVLGTILGFALPQPSIKATAVDKNELTILYDRTENFGENPDARIHFMGEDQNYMITLEEIKAGKKLEIPYGEYEILFEYFNVSGLQLTDIYLEDNDNYCDIYNRLFVFTSESKPLTLIYKNRIAGVTIQEEDIEIGNLSTVESGVCDLIVTVHSDTYEDYVYTSSFELDHSITPMQIPFAFYDTYDINITTNENIEFYYRVFDGNTYYITKDARNILIGSEVTIIVEDKNKKIPIVNYFHFNSEDFDGEIPDDITVELQHKDNSITNITYNKDDLEFYDSLMGAKIIVDGSNSIKSAKLVSKQLNSQYHTIDDVFMDFVIDEAGNDFIYIETGFTGYNKYNYKKKRIKMVRKQPLTSKNIITAVKTKDGHYIHKEHYAYYADKDYFEFDAIVNSEPLDLYVEEIDLSSQYLEPQRQCIFDGDINIGGYFTLSNDDKVTYVFGSEDEDIVTLVSLEKYFNNLPEKNIPTNFFITITENKTNTIVETITYDDIKDNNSVWFNLPYGEYTIKESNYTSLDGLEPISKALAFIEVSIFGKAMPKLSGYIDEPADTMKLQAIDEHTWLLNTTNYRSCNIAITNYYNTTQDLMVALLSYGHAIPESATVELVNATTGEVYDWFDSTNSNSVGNSLFYVFENVPQGHYYLREWGAEVDSYDLTVKHNTPVHLDVILRSMDVYTPKGAKPNLTEPIYPSDEFEVYVNYESGPYLITNTYTPSVNNLSFKISYTGTPIPDQAKFTVKKGSEIIKEATYAQIKADPTVLNLTDTGIGEYTIEYTDVEIDSYLPPTVDITPNQTVILKSKAEEPDGKTVELRFDYLEKTGTVKVKVEATNGTIPDEATFTLSDGTTFKYRDIKTTGLKEISNLKLGDYTLTGTGFDQTNFTYTTDGSTLNGTLTYDKPLVLVYKVNYSEIPRGNLAYIIKGTGQTIPDTATITIKKNGTVLKSAKYEDIKADADLLKFENTEPATYTLEFMGLDVAGYNVRLENENEVTPVTLNNKDNKTITANFVYTPKTGSIRVTVQGNEPIPDKAIIHLSDGSTYKFEDIKTDAKNGYLEVTMPIGEHTVSITGVEVTGYTPTITGNTNGILTENTPLVLNITIDYQPIPKGTVTARVESLGGDIPDDANIIIKDETGKKIIEKKYSEFKDTNRFETADLPLGKYTIEIIDAENPNTPKVTGTLSGVLTKDSGLELVITCDYSKKLPSTPIIDKDEGSIIITVTSKGVQTPDDALIKLYDPEDLKTPIKEWKYADGKTKDGMKAQFTINPILSKKGYIVTIENATITGYNLKSTEKVVFDVLKDQIALAEIVNEYSKIANKDTGIATNSVLTIFVLAIMGLVFVEIYKKNNKNT